MNQPSHDAPARSEIPAGLQEPVVARTAVARGLMAVLGTIFLGLGLLGIALPLLPATPFLLLSAACYARSSRRLYVWLLNMPGVGDFIVRWKTTRTVSPRAKAAALTLILIAFIPSVAIAPLVPVKIGLALLGIGITAIVLRLPTSAAALPVPVPADPEQAEMPIDG